MFCLFSSKRRTMLGIDIRHQSIQLVQLSYQLHHTNVQYCLEHYAHIERSQTGEQSLRQLLTAIPIAYERVIIAVPDALTIHKVLLFHIDVHESYLEQLVRLEAKKHLTAEDDIYVDFKMLGLSLEQLDMAEVLMVAARSNAVNERVQLLKQAFLEVDVVDVETYAIERMMPFVLPDWLVQDHSKHVMVLHLEPKQFHVWILGGMRVLFSHEAASDPLWTQMMQQVSLALNYFFTKYMPVRIDYIVLMGSLSCHSEAEGYFEHHFSIPTHTANPFASMRKSIDIDEAHLSYHAPRFAMACGLALRVNE